MLHEKENKLQAVFVRPNYTFVFNMEKGFTYRESIDWLGNNVHLPIYYSLIYLILIFGLKHYMKSRPRLQLQGFLIIWNLLLAAFSICGAIRTLAELIYALREFGFHHSICRMPLLEHRTIFGFWSYLFTLSKVVEFGDTVFIVLRKQPLIFLHWYHHISVLNYTWFSTGQEISTGRWFSSINLCIHSLMYSYYALKSLGYRIPRVISMLITAAQLQQMIIGLFVNYWAYTYVSRGDYCEVSMKNITASLLMYFSYFILFLHFFCKAYFFKTSSKPAANMKYKKG